MIITKTGLPTLEPVANELVFVVIEGYQGGWVAIEGTHGLVAFGESRTDLTMDVIDKVQRYFKEGYGGLIRLREAKDRVITLRYKPRKLVQRIR